MTEDAEVAGARIASSASLKARFVPTGEGPVDKDNNGSTEWERGVHEGLMQG